MLSIIAPSYAFVFICKEDESMNPITRMMKRYIKTPLKYALPLLFICSLALVSISGCTSSTSSPTATPSATPSVTTTTSSFDPLLVKLQTALNSEYGSTWLISRMNASTGANEIYMTPKANSSTVTNVWFTTTVASPTRAQISQHKQARRHPRITGRY